LWRSLVVLRLLLGMALRISLLERLPHLPGDEKERWERLWRQEGRRMRRAAERHGGLLVKLGQFLSTRADVLPQPFTQELGTLQDVVPPAPWADIEAILTKAYGAPPDAVFRSVEHEAHAAASLAQVHFAVLPDGRPCALKILRPGITALVQRDLNATHLAARVLQHFGTLGSRFDIVAIWREFAEVTLQELDLPGEAERAKRFRKAFARTRWVRAPKLYDPWTRPQVLAMERVGGVKPDDLEGLKAIGVAPRKVAERLTDSYMKQWLVDGFFHADPHPGNLFVQADGTLVYVDFGMMGEVREQDRLALRKLVLGVAMRDGETMAEAVDELGFLRPGADHRRLKTSLALLVNRLFEHGAGLQKGEEAARFAREIEDFIFEGPFQIPARYTFLGRAFGILAGQVALLAPEENFVDLLVRSAERYAYSDASLVREALTHVGRRIGKPVRQALRVLEELDNGTLMLPLDVVALRKETRQLARGQRRVALAILAGAAALLAVLPDTLLVWERHLSFVVACLLALWALFG
jgi:predicted unusual protein kinase regulating ubiquinone biosynthesis (AarF/ABC1/UbiB family)